MNAAIKVLFHILQYISVSNAVAEPKLKWNIPWDKIKEQNVGINKQLGKLKAFTKIMFIK